ncbi:phytanoyl-CoA dioxygenase family protein [Micromonospora fluostatini]
MGTHGGGAATREYVVAPDWLPPQWCDRLRAGLDDLASTEPGRKRLMPHPPFLRLLAEGVLDPLVRPVLGDTYLFHHANGMRLTRGEGKAWHHDYDSDQPWDGRSDTAMVHVMIYPAGLTADNGPLVLRPDTHTARVPRHHPNRYGFEVGPDDVTVVGGAGTVAVVNSATWHMRPPSPHGSVRYYLNYSFIGPGAAARPERDEYHDLLATLPTLVDDPAGAARLSALCRRHAS